jgi:hypothetical protein
MYCEWDSLKALALSLACSDGNHVAPLEHLAVSVMALPADSLISHVLPLRVLKPLHAAPAHAGAVTVAFWLPC